MADAHTQPAAGTCLSDRLTGSVADVGRRRLPMTTMILVWVVAVLVCMCICVKRIMAMSSKHIVAHTNSVSKWIDVAQHRTPRAADLSDHQPLTLSLTHSPTHLLQIRQPPPLSPQSINSQARLAPTCLSLPNFR